MPYETHTGVFLRFSYHKPDSDWKIGFLEDGSKITGTFADGDLIPSVVYTFHGEVKETEQYGKDFAVKHFIAKVPHSRHGIVAYLAKYAANVGPAVAARLWDAFGSDAVSVLRTSPDEVVKVPAVRRFLTLEKAREAAAELKQIEYLEDTKVSLMNLFDGRGFPAVLIEECISKWGILAPARIARDPFCLLVEELSGCGFDRCDRLYGDMGLPPARLKRQVICLWYLLRDLSGSTWADGDLLETRLLGKVGGTEVNYEKAVTLGVRSGWLAQHVDAAGKRWLAEGAKAKQERFVAAKLLVLSQWQPTEVEGVQRIRSQPSGVCPMLGGAEGIASGSEGSATALSAI